MTDDWQPIETAPRDGTSVLLFYPPDYPDGPWMEVARWRDMPREINGNCWTVGGIDPTHWRPLPEPPKEDG